VVNVRRQTDNAEQEFTASGVASGALVSFVNADGTQFMAFDGTDDDIDVNAALLPETGDFTLTITFFIAGNPSSTESIFGQGNSSGAGSTGRSVVQINTSGLAFAFINGFGDLTTGNAIVPQSINTIVLSRSGTTLSLKLNTGTAVTLTESASTPIAQVNSKIGHAYAGANFEGVITSLSVGSTTWDGTAANASSQGWTVNGSPSTNALNNGFVETWFDQSGNGKNATQASLDDQPKIVENGTAKDHLLFTASNTESFDISSAGSIFRNKAFGYLTAVVQHTDSSSGTEPYFYASEGGTSGSARVQFGQRGSNIEILAKPDDDQTFGNSTRAASTDKLLLTGVIKFAADSIQLFSNGTAHTAGTFPAAQNTDDDDSLAVRIGRSSTNYMDGKIYELVVYNTDKSGIRSEIETNIADEYNITLS
jgi:hypothetical protein